MRTYAMPALRVFVLAVEHARAAKNATVATLVAGSSTVPRITTAATWTVKPDVCVNIGLTHDGLTALGMSAEVACLVSRRSSWKDGGAGGTCGRCRREAPEHWKNGLAGPLVHRRLSVRAVGDALNHASSGLRRLFAADHAFTVLSGTTPADSRATSPISVIATGFSQPAIQGRIAAPLPDVLPGARRRLPQRLSEPVGRNHLSRAAARRPRPATAASSRSNPRAGLRRIRTLRPIGRLSRPGSIANWLCREVVRSLAQRRAAGALA